MWVVVGFRFPRFCFREGARGVCLTSLLGFSSPVYSFKEEEARGSVIGFVAPVFFPKWEGGGGGAVVGFFVPVCCWKIKGSARGGVTAMLFTKAVFVLHCRVRFLRMGEAVCLAPPRDTL